MWQSKLKGIACCLPVILCSIAQAIPIQLSDCDQLIATESPYVKQAFYQAKGKGVITPQHRCKRVYTEEVTNTGALINGLPENTVLLIVQRQQELQPGTVVTIYLNPQPDHPPSQPAS